MPLFTASAPRHPILLPKPFRTVRDLAVIIPTGWEHPTLGQIFFNPFYLKKMIVELESEKDPAWIKFHMGDGLSVPGDYLTMPAEAFKVFGLSEVGCMMLEYDWQLTNYGGIVYKRDEENPNGFEPMFYQCFIDWWTNH